MRAKPEPAHRPYRVCVEQSMARETNLGGPVGDHVGEQARYLNLFDYSASAELFMTRRAT
jgi:hypothetical protein